MFNIHSDPEKNRLYITLAGHLESSERQQAAKVYLAALKELRPGFDIINDLTALHPTDKDGIQELIRLQSATRIKGLRTVIRVARIPITRRQLERVAEETGWTYETAETVAEAEARLDQLERT